MKPLKLGLRVWFTITSLLSFLVGWMLLSHAGKPAPLIPSDSSSSSSTSSSVSVNNPLPTLVPLPSLNSLTSGSSSLQSLPSVSSSAPQSFFPSFRGRGS